MTATSAKGFTSCEWCGGPAVGLAFIGDDAFCHADEGPTPTCYEQAQAVEASFDLGWSGWQENGSEGSAS